MKFIIVILLSFLVMLSCINPIDNFEQVSSNSFLAIEAELSNEKKAHEVRLSMTSDKLGLVSDKQKPISGAQVYILDENGTKEVLFENPNLEGAYLTSNNYAGRIGGKYVLYIKTINGDEYQSDPEIIRPSPIIGNVNSKFEVLTNFQKGDERRNGFNISIDFKDNIGTSDFYQWQWKHYEKAKTCATCNGFIGTTPFAANYDFVTGKCVETGPADAFERKVEINYKCEDNCWNITTSNNFNLLSDALYQNKEIVGKRVARIPFDSTSKYYLQIEQRAISKKTFDFLQNLTDQVQNSGTIFDLPAETSFNTNINSVNNKSQRVLGIFNVYSVSKKIIYIDRSKGVPADEKPIIKYEVGYFKCPKEGAFECRDIAKCFETNSRTKFKPEGWLDKP